MLLCLLTTSFNTARFEHENEMRRKALKQKKNLESSPFWNPESTELESGIQYSESGIHRVESRIQDCHGFPYMGRSSKRPPPVSDRDHFLGLTVDGFPLLLTSCKRPLDAFSDLYVRCVDYAT